MKRLVLAATLVLALMLAPSASANNIPDSGYFFVAYTPQFAFGDWPGVQGVAHGFWVGEGVLIRGHGPTMWNAIEVCASQLVKGGWKQFACKQSGVKWTGYQSEYSGFIAPLVPHRWYAIWVGAKAKTPSGYRSNAVRGAAICFRSSGSNC